MQRYLMLFLFIPFLCFSLQSCDHKNKVDTSPVVDNGPLINKQVGNLFLAKNKQNSGIVTTPSGLQFYIVRNGVGAHPSPSDLVTVFYEGQFINGKVFDAQHYQNSPVTIRVSSVIPGWQQALQMMQPGSIWVIYVPPNLGYGDKGIPGLIPPNETLIYTINLVGYKKG